MNGKMIAYILGIFLLTFSFSAFSEDSDTAITNPFPVRLRFFQAVADGDIEEIKSLAGGGIDVNMNLPEEGSGQTALMLCTTTETVEVLLESGADVTLKDKEGATVLHYAVLNDNALETLPLLVEAGADVNVCTLKYHESPLMYAREWFFGRDEEKGKQVMKLLLDAGADINTADDTGYTLLLYAAVNRKSDLLVFLLEQGADRYRKSQDGKTALDYAGELNFPEIKTILEKNR